MLWWDDNCAKQKKQENPVVHPVILENGDEIANCFRNTGAVPVPRKVSKSYNVPIQRKISAPDISTPKRQPPIPSRKISCPAPRTVVPPPKPQLKLLAALQEALEDLSEDILDLVTDKTKTAIPRCSVQPASEAAKYVKATHKPKLIKASEKAQTTEAQVKKELKRGSMKEKWGLGLVYRMEDSRIELAVNKVSMFSPAAKAGIQTGDTILLINDWKVEAMDQIQAALNIFLAAGFSVNLGWTKTSSCLEGWGPLETI